MHYLNFKRELKEFTVFSMQDIRKIQPNFHRRQLVGWQDKGYIKKIIRGHYIFSDLQIDEAVLFTIANRIYEPSYISLEMALSFYDLIPEGVYSVTSVGTKKTSQFNTEVANFSYKKIKKEIFFGYILIERNGIVYKMAEMEKALLDFMYLNPNYKTSEDFLELRLNKEVLAEKFDTEKFKLYLEQYGNKSLDKRAKILLKFFNYA